MEIVHLVQIDEIEEHLIKHGRGNHEDNMRQVRDASAWFLGKISEQEFKSLIFLESTEVASIMPPGLDRRLEAVATRAIELPSDGTRLSGNWDIGKIEEKTEVWLADPESPDLPALLLRDVRGGESKWEVNGWYLQDGSHRALGYLMAIMKEATTYCPVRVYCATHRDLTRLPG